MADDVTVRVRGLEETQRAFRQIQHRAPPGLAKSMKAIADHVVGVAQQRMPFRTGEAAKSLKPKGTAKGAGISFPAGGAPWRGVKADYYPWLDFGGTTGKGHVANGHNGFGGSVKRSSPKGGRYLYPAIGESTAFISDETDKALKRVFIDAGFETKGHV